MAWVWKYKLPKLPLARLLWNSISIPTTERCKICVCSISDTTRPREIIRNLMQENTGEYSNKFFLKFFIKFVHHFSLFSIKNWETLTLILMLNAKKNIQNSQKNQNFPVSSLNSKYSLVLENIQSKLTVWKRQHLVKLFVSSWTE